VRKKEHHFTTLARAALAVICWISWRCANTANSNLKQTVKSRRVNDKHSDFHKVESTIKACQYHNTCIFVNKYTNEWEMVYLSNVWKKALW